ncbi:MAG: carbohydrate ABC transporter substrate-binding protein [Microbacteriaceae bacterium]|nr:carbohydrate ABC transporter substrate-binding protein [Microbacteriaceae bacterium]
MGSALHIRLMVPLALLAVSGMALTGCSRVDSHGESGPGDAGKADGVVTILGPLFDTEAELLQQSWADWEKENGIQIRYEPSKEFDTQIRIRVEGDNAPDLAIFPQPDLLAGLASSDLIQPAPDVVKANVNRYWSNDWVAYGTTGGVLYGAPFLASIQSFIWYSPLQFADNGWKVPKTWSGLLDLTAQMQEELGTAPWCAGFGSESVTRGTGTDWIETLILGHAGPYTYDQWVNHEVKFSDPAIKDAFDSLGTILLNPDFVNTGIGDVESITTTSLSDVARAMGSGTCALTQQAASFDGLLTDPESGNTTVGPGLGVWAFLTPPAVAGGNAVTGGGEFVAAFSNDTDTVKVQQYLSSPEWANSRVSLGGVASANNGLDSAKASSPILQESVRILQDPRTTFRIDGSRLMPPFVGAGSFGKGMVDWLNGDPVDEVLATIDDSWPSD